MKALTVWQPWASLIAIGAKKYETRGWATSYRGPIAICAGAKPADYVLKNLVDEKTRNVMLKALASEYADEAGLLFANDLPHGSIVATARLAQCWEFRGFNGEGNPFLTAVDRDGAHFLTITRKNEPLFGDYSPGRYAWELVDVKMLGNPIKARGQQRLWEWREEV